MCKKACPLLEECPRMIEHLQERYNHLQVVSDSKGVKVDFFHDKDVKETVAIKTYDYSLMKFGTDHLTKVMPFLFRQLRALQVFEEESTLLRLKRAVKVSNIKYLIIMQAANSGNLRQFSNSAKQGLLHLEEEKKEGLKESETQEVAK
jgi:hypothetical protein